MIRKLAIALLVCAATGIALFAKAGDAVARQECYAVASYYSHALHRHTTRLECFQDNWLFGGFFDWTAY